MQTTTYDETKWKLVPLEATKQQLDEARKHIMWACMPEIEDIYKAMVAVVENPPPEHCIGPRDEAAKAAE